MNIDDSILNKLTDDQKKKVEAAQTPEELLALAKEAGRSVITCPKCVLFPGKSFSS